MSGLINQRSDQPSIARNIFLGLPWSTVNCFITRRKSANSNAYLLTNFRRFANTHEPYHVKLHCSSVLQRIDKIHNTLARDLDVVFSAALLSVTSPSSADQQSTTARARAMSEISECLLIYQTLERWDVAEEVIRQDIVTPFVKKVRSILSQCRYHPLTYETSCRLYTLALCLRLFPLLYHAPHFSTSLQCRLPFKTGRQLRTPHLHHILARCRISHSQIYRPLPLLSITP